jgi:hypothetical protein
LDFKKITEIGQAFADEIFRVYANEHPDNRIIPVDENTEVAMMIQRALKYDGQAGLPS